MMLSSVEAAYIAGFVDGEGCFTTVKGRRNGYPSLSIKQCGFKTLRWIHQRVDGGGVYNAKVKRPGIHRPLCEFHISGDRCIALVAQIVSYLKEKREQAELLLYRHRVLQEAGFPRLDEETALLDRIGWKLKVVKKHTFDQEEVKQANQKSFCVRSLEL